MPHRCRHLPRHRARNRAVPDGGERGHQPGVPAGRRSRRRRPAGPEVGLRLHQPADLPPGRHVGVPRHPAGHRLDAPRRTGTPGSRRAKGSARPSTSSTPGARLHPAGDRQGLRHDDRRRHAKRRRLHHRAAPRRRLFLFSPRAGTTGPFGKIKIFIPNGPVASPSGSALSAGGGEPGRRGRMPSAAWAPGPSAGRSAAAVPVSRPRR
jgi:hypothetical protein